MLCSWARGAGRKKPRQRSPLLLISNVATALSPPAMFLQRSVATLHRYRNLEWKWAREGGIRSRKGGRRWQTPVRSFGKENGEERKKEANKLKINKPRELERGLEVQERQVGKSTKGSRQFTH